MLKTHYPPQSGRPVKVQTGNNHKRTLDLLIFLKESMICIHISILACFYAAATFHAVQNREQKEKINEHAIVMVPVTSKQVPVVGLSKFRSTV